MKVDFVDVIAYTIIIICFLLIYLGRDSFVETVLGTVVGYYFGKKRGETIGKRLGE